MAVATANGIDAEEPFCSSRSGGGSSATTVGIDPKSAGVAMASVVATATIAVDAFSELASSEFIARDVEVVEEKEGGERVVPPNLPHPHPAPRLLSSVCQVRE